MCTHTESISLEERVDSYPEEEEEIQIAHGRYNLPPILDIMAEYIGPLLPSSVASFRSKSLLAFLRIYIKPGQRNCCLYLM